MKSENIVEFVISVYETDSGFVIGIPPEFEISLKALMQKAAQKAIDTLAPFIKSPTALAKVVVEFFEEDKK